MTRQPYGTGSIRQLAENRWKLTIPLPTDPVTGNRRQASRTFTGSRSAARKALAAFLTERGSGRLDGSSITVVGLVAEWLDNDTTLSPTTRADYERVRKWLQGPFGAKLASKVTVMEVRDFYRTLAKQGVTPWRVQRLHEVLRRSFNLGVKWEWLPRNVVLLAAPPTPRREKPRPTSIDDASKLLLAAGYDFGTWLRVAAVTGARRGEVCGLQWGDIGLEVGVVRFARAVIYTPETGVITKETKTGKERLVSIDEATGQMLARFFATCVHRAEMAGCTLTPTSYVFSTDLCGATPWRPDRPTQRFIRLRNQLGIDVPLKGLRHGSATYLMDQGFGAPSVAGRHGHAKSSMTLDVYSHAVPATDRAAALAIGRAIDTAAQSNGER